MLLFIKENKSQKELYRYTEELEVNRSIMVLK